MPTPKIIRTYTFMIGGCENTTIEDQVKLEHVQFDMDSVESDECPICMGNLDKHHNCAICGYNHKEDTEETLIEKWIAWSAKQ